MKFFTFTLEKTVLFYKGGEFQAKGPWRHRAFVHKGDYEIIYCVNGPIYIQVGEDKFTVNNGQILIVPPFVKFEGYADSKGNVDFYWLHFFSQYKEDTFLADPDKLKEDLKNKKIKKHTVTMPECFKPSNGQQSLILLHQILSIHDDLSYVEERDYLTSALLIQLFKSFLYKQETTEESTRMNYIKEWIRANMSTELTVSEIADRIHLNPDYLTRLFKKYTGMTTLQYINSLKIEVASLLLIRTEKSIKEISDLAYFSDPKIFMRRFKRETGLSPTEYRNSNNMIHLNNPHVDPQIPIPKRIADAIDYIPENGEIPE